jgi:hypothetical protein
VLTEGISMIFKDLLPNDYVFKKMNTMMAITFSAIYHLVSKSLINGGAQFKAALKRYLITHSFHLLS